MREDADPLHPLTHKQVIKSLTLFAWGGAEAAPPKIQDDLRKHLTRGARGVLAFIGAGSINMSHARDRLEASALALRSLLKEALVR